MVMQGVGTKFKLSILMLALLFAFGMHPIHTLASHPTLTSFVVHPLCDEVGGPPCPH